jgi:hypothetical protein
MNYIFARLAEPSTWRGLVALVAAFGVVVSPDQIEAIVAAGLAMIGIIGAFLPDRVQG